VLNRSRHDPEGSASECRQTLACSLFGPKTFLFFSDCDVDGFNSGTGVQARRENASLNPNTLKSIGFS
jgi:hypothetical protein